MIVSLSLPLLWSCSAPIRGCNITDFLTRADASDISPRFTSCQDLRYRPGPGRQTERTYEHSRSGGLQIQMGSTQRYLLLLLLHWSWHKQKQSNESGCITGREGENLTQGTHTTNIFYNTLLKYFHSLIVVSHVRCHNLIYHLHADNWHQGLISAPFSSISWRSDRPQAASI